MNIQKEYICKIASTDELETKWNHEIQTHKSDNWKIWKAEAIGRSSKGLITTYYGILNGEIICEATAMFDKSIVQNGDGLVDGETAYLCAFRTVDKLRGRGYFSPLFRFMLDNLKRRGYSKVTLGVEPRETEILKIHKHFGFIEFIKSAKKSYPDGATVDIDYYGIKL